MSHQRGKIESYDWFGGGGYVRSTKEYGGARFHFIAEDNPNLAVDTPVSYDIVDDPPRATNIEARERDANDQYPFLSLAAGGSPQKGGAGRG